MYCIHCEASVPRRTARAKPGWSCRAGGFTLLEVLVVLAMTSMLSVLLIDGVAQVLLIEQRMGVRSQAFREQHLGELWLRQLIAGGLASREHPFEMASGRVRGLTLAPLAAEYSVPMPFELAVVSGGAVTELRYSEGGEEYVLVRFDNSELRDSPRILALQDDGTYSTQWRSNNGGAQWPRGLALQIPELDGDVVWHVAVEGRRTLPPRFDSEAGI